MTKDEKYLQQVEELEQRLRNLNRLLDTCRAERDKAIDRNTTKTALILELQRKVSNVNNLCSLLRAFKLGEQAAAITAAMNANP